MKVPTLPQASAETADQTMQFYNAARAEIVERVILRDQALFAYIITAGAYFGFVVQGESIDVSDNKDILYNCAISIVLPTLSLVFTYIILQHHVMIGRMGDYTRSLFPETVNHWDQHYISWVDRKYLSARTFSQALLLVMPVIYSGLFLTKAFPAVAHDWPVLSAVVAVAGFSAFVLVAIIRAHVWAYSVRRSTDYPRPAS